MNRLLIASVLAILMIAPHARAQRWVQPQRNLNDIRAEVGAYFDSLINAGDSSIYKEGSEYSQYRQFINYWEPRLSPHGDFLRYFEGLKNHYRDTIPGEGSPFLPSVARMATNLDGWHELGPFNKTTGNNGVGPIRCLRGHPLAPDRLLAASHSGGLFVTTNGGTTWQQKYSDAWSRSSCRTVEYDPSNPDIYYAATSISPDAAAYIGYTAGIYRCTPAGSKKIADQSKLGGPWNMIHKMVMLNSNIMYVATDLGLYISANVTVTNPAWTLRSLAGKRVFDLEVIPGGTVTTAVMFAVVADHVTGGYGNWQFVMSTNGGVTWSPLPSQPAGLTAGARDLSVELTPADYSRVYCLNFGTGNIYMYSASSSTWQFVYNTSPVHSQGRAFAVNKVNPNILYVGDGIFATRKIIGGAATFLTGFHPDAEQFVCHPTLPGKVWIAHHGGVSVSESDGVGWTDLCDGLAVAEFTAMSNSYTNPELILGGTYHNGSILTTTAPYSNTWKPSWKWVTGGDGLRALVDYTNPDYMYTSSQGGSWSRSTNRGLSFSSLPGAGGNWESEAVLNKVDPRIMYRQANVAGISSIYRSFDRGSTNAVISPNFSTLTGVATKNLVWRIYTAHHKDYICAHVITDPNTTNEKHWLFRTKQANLASAAAVKTTWENLPLPRNAYLADVDFDVNNPEFLYLTYGSGTFYNSNISGTQMVYRMNYTFPTGHVAGTCGFFCTDLTYNLPNTGVGLDALAIEKGSNGGMYIATDVGVFFINNPLIDQQQYWQKLGTALPNNGKTGLEINYKINKLRVATFGRGAWEHPLFCPPTFDLTLTLVSPPLAYHEVENNITSTQIIPVGGTCTYRAGNRIALKPGFRTLPSAGFRAFIHGCNRPGNSFNRDQDLDEAEEMPAEEAKEAGHRSALVIYPNPVRRQLFIRAEGEMAGKVIAYEILDITGRTVKSGSLEASEADRALDISGLYAGLYLIKVSGGERFFTYKFIKSE
jgi:hypothetical protein